MMTTEQRRALANTIPTTDVIRDAVTFPRDRLGEPLDISAERFDAWLVQVKRDAAREALDGLEVDTAQIIRTMRERGEQGWSRYVIANDILDNHRTRFYPEEATE